VSEIVKQKPAVAQAKKATSGIVVIDSIIPRANAEKPNILISGHDAENTDQRIANAFYMHTDKCRQISREQIQNLFGMDAIQLATTADDIAQKGIRLRYKGEPDGEFYNYSYYPEKSAIDVTLATSVFGA
jgi:hypothetical protein